MSAVTLAQLQAIMPLARARAATFLAPLNATMLEFGINTPERVAAFLATIAHESAQLSRFDENLSYSAAGLLSTFGRYFTPAQAAVYARQPERIANRVYANRMGNGDEASGDGWRRSGAGAIQLTGTHNQRACAAYFKIPMTEIAAWLRTPTGAIRSAGWFWFINGLKSYADAGDFDGVCDVVNRGKKTGLIGDSIGWPDRLALYKVAQKVLQ